MKKNNKTQTVCHCNLKENATLIAEILDVDAMNKVYDVKPKAVWKVWRNYPTIYGHDDLYVCSLCSAKFTNKTRYCACCGSYMDGEEEAYNG